MSREILIRNAIRCLSVLFIVISNTLQSYADTWGDYGTYSISWYNKSQTEFTISTPEELAGVAYLVNNNFTSFSGKKIYIDADINLYGRSWTPIGINTTIFEGEIVGNNHSIYNLKIENEFDNKSGFFIDLRNAQLRDVRFQGSVSSKVAFTVGLVAASATSTEFINLRVDNSIQVRKYEVGFASNSSYTLEIGGVIGKSSKCKYSNIKSLSSLDFQWGTLDGNNCYGKMSLSCGGLVGESNKDSFEKCQS